jgi:hypothetical protein
MVVAVEVVERRGLLGGGWEVKPVSAHLDPVSMAEQEANRGKRRERDIGAATALRQIAGDIVLDEWRYRELRCDREDGEHEERPNDEPPHRAKLRTRHNREAPDPFGTAFRLARAKESWLRGLRLIAEITENRRR